VTRAPENLAARIDHTLLRADATGEDIDRLCDEAKRFHFAAVCVNPTWVARCAERLKDSGVLVCAVVGFPLGAHLPEVKALEAKRAVADGAAEVDMVADLGALKSGHDARYDRDIRAVVSEVGPAVTVKVVLETARLGRDEIVRAAEIVKAAGAKFVKTSTGFAGEATVDDVRLLRETVGSAMGIKASGGIRTRAEALALIEAGATRIGTSSGVAIVSGGEPASVDRPAGEVLEPHPLTLPASRAGGRS